MADEDDEARARLTANLETLAQAMPQLLEQFRTLARSLARDSIAGKIVDVAEEQRLAAFVKLVTLLARGGDGLAQSLELAPLVDATLAVTRAEITRRARLFKVYAPAPPVLATERQLVQLLLDVLLAVAQSLPEGDPERTRLALRVGTSDAGWAMLELEPGGGIDAAAIEAALATARALAVELGGRLGVARDGGRPAALRLELPPATAPATHIRA